MAEPIQFPQANHVWKAPDGMDECLDLHVMQGHAGGLPFSASCWKLTDEEIADIVKTGKIYLIIHGMGHPVVSMQTRLGK